MNQTTQLATLFATKLQAEIGADNYAKMIELNAVAEPGVCHSHDFCDANMVMHEAYTEVMGFEPDFDNDEWIDTFNAAWDAFRADTLPVAA